ncbi:hypothetical protein GALMADRAFT_1239396 [Galerina marginata CBS 339.88]|uniref:Uncharacterized protein n=1 Tax=Galerina marginata (strain CBS 339.88) TaxID=685588 RepID=A0A067TAP0_GALM3|nr:hypothetical protein GALMADRAFT_1239396 [Galerina marginata CBS 339.88]
MVREFGSYSESYRCGDSLGLCGGSSHRGHRAFSHVYKLDCSRLSELFLDTLPIKPPRWVTEEQVTMALEHYKISEAAKVHRAIREYANKSTFVKILQSNKAQEKVIELIRQHRAGGA